MNTGEAKYIAAFTDTAPPPRAEAVELVDLLLPGSSASQPLHRPAIIGHTTIHTTKNAQINQIVPAWPA